MGFDIQIRNVSEVEGNENELADPKTMSIHCVAFEGKKHTPASQLLDILKILYRQGDWLAFVMHAPGEYTAKVQNLVRTKFFFFAYN